MYLADPNILWLMLGPSQNFSRKPTADCSGCSCSSQHWGRGTWFCGTMGVLYASRCTMHLGGFRWLRKSNAEKKPRAYTHTFSFSSQLISTSKNEVSVFNRAEAILELQRIPLSCTNCVFWHFPNHVSPLPFFPPSFLNIPPLLRTLHKQLGNGEQRKLKWIFGTPDGAEETQKTESCLACDSCGDFDS